MSEDNKSIEEIIAISYFDTDNIDIKKHTERYFEIRRNIVDVLNKYNIMWTVTDTNSFNNKDKEIERLNNIINEALGIANERFNYYSNHKNNNEEHLEDWGNIFNILLRRDNK